LNRVPSLPLIPKGKWRPGLLICKILSPILSARLPNFAQHPFPAHSYFRV
jgi:hypothetical protein